MPSFTDLTTSEAAPEAVWKLLYDPVRFPDWWAGVGSVEVGGDSDFTMYPEGYPEFPLAQMLLSERDQGRVTVSCMVSDLVFRWRLEPLDADAGTTITVDVDIPEAEAARLDTQREVISASLRNLASLAETQAAGV
jgi:uncharacterized protein YndB with AHSA1/START domain